ncbi:ATP-binding cassette domain-containing protein [Actinoallomurus rhizosphaericola]|uniref:ATP-binding cassette domain-containing protein n=1 Tax=Actinoallomurus rhizosphaericola TaxID=2952536 RepID=UPI0020932D13|nr:ATP-binding cassette domain-containing protein [Actinoallomurus rhizosphaericola]MCO6000077.1 ATP-binding cassette domain-containing protein [Actinoallomurus rhizosphaericola]
MTEPLLEARGIERSFGQVQALRGADFTVYRGEIVALIGDNGAGKSTLVKILSGADQPNAGQIFVEGRPVRLDSPHAARDLGIETVYQDLALASDLDPAANLFLGREVFRRGLLGRLGFLDKRAMARDTTGEMERLGVHLKDAAAPVAALSGGQRQSVAVARAAMWARRVIFMDEPTAALGVVQTQQVLELIRRVRDAGIAVVLISHNMPQVLEVADRVEVLRLGARVARFKAADATVEDLVAAMTSGTAEERAA